MNKLENLLKNNDITVSFLPEGKIRCVKSLLFPDKIERLIYKNYDFKFEDVIDCVNDFINFYKQVKEEVIEDFLEEDDLK